MSDQDNCGGGAVPIACSLSGEAYRTRLEWIALLNQDALLSARRDGASLHLRYRANAGAAVDELIRRERACCPFFTFDRRTEAGAIALSVSAPAEAAASAELIFAEIMGHTAS